MTFTAQQKTFADKIFEGSKKSDAYREAYAPVSMSRKTIWEASSRLSKNPKVVANKSRIVASAS